MLFIIGLTIDAVGKILLGATVLFVHWHVLKEHAIDENVLRTMRREQVMGIIGIICIVVGSALQVVSIILK